MKKIVLLIALALGIFACDDGKKDNGGGGSVAENLGNIKIGDTLSGKSIPIKSALSTPAETSISYNSPSLYFENGETFFSDILEFDLNNEDCKQYWRVLQFTIYRYTCIICQIYHPLWDHFHS